MAVGWKSWTFMQLNVHIGCPEAHWSRLTSVSGDTMQGKTLRCNSGWSIGISIQRSMGSSLVCVQYAFHNHFPCVSVLCLPFQNVHVYLLLHHSFTSSCHSLFRLPIFVFPSSSPNTTSFSLPVCYLPFYRCVQISSISFPWFSVWCFSSYPFFFCCHLTFRILRYRISSQMSSVCSCLFLQCPRFTCIQYYADYAGYHNVSLSLYANAFAFPDVLELWHR